MTRESNNAPISADDAFDAAVAIARNVVAKSPEGEWSQLNQAASEFAAPYLARIAELSEQLTNADPKIPADYVRRLRAALTAEHPEVIIDAAARVVRERNDALARIAELETEARRNRIAIDALTESGKASAGIVAKLEAENTALHEDCNKAMKAMQACLDLEKRDIAFVIHREAQLHETLRLFALPTDPKAFAREMNGRNKDRDELCERLAKLESDNKALHDALACATMDSLGKAIRGES